MIPRTLFTEEHQLFRESARKFFEHEVIPFHHEWEKQGMVPRELWLKAGNQGFLCCTMPEEYGGAGLDFSYSAILMEEQARAFSSGPGFALHTDIVAPYILHYGSEEQKKRFLPRMASGEIITAIAMSEPAAGSDLQGIKSTAVKKGENYILNGSKTFITNGWHSDLVIVVVKTDPSQGAGGISLLLVENGMPGFSKGKRLEKIGLKAQDTCELFFDNVEVPAVNLLGQEGAGFMYLMSELPQERLLIAVVAAMTMEVCFEETLRYTKERNAFGKPVFNFQNTRFKLAEIQSEIVMARVFTDRCIELHLSGQLDLATAAMAKLRLSEMQCKVVDECLQLFGGYGYIWDFPIARAFTDSRVQKIYGGTNEIMKELISRFL